MCEGSWVPKPAARPCPVPVAHTAEDVDRYVGLFGEFLSEIT